MIAALTGHRPEKIKHAPAAIGARLRYVFDKHNVTHVITGMAAGFDIIGGMYAREIGLPYTCARPWAEHTPRIGDESDYAKLLHNASRVVEVDPSLTYAGPWVYHKRNEWMVDNADFVIAYWDGSLKGGTAGCVKYAKKQGKGIVNIYG